MARTLYHDTLPPHRKAVAAYTCPAGRCHSIQPIVRCPHTSAGPGRGASSSPSTSVGAALGTVIDRSFRRLAAALTASAASAPRPWVDRGQGLPVFSMAPPWRVRH